MTPGIGVMTLVLVLLVSGAILLVTGSTVLGAPLFAAGLAAVLGLGVLAYGFQL